MTIPRVNSDRFTVEFGDLTRPAIITDALGGWRIDERWTPEQIGGRVGHRQIQISRTKQKMFQHSPTRVMKAEYTSEAADFRAAVKAISVETDEQLYVMQQTIPEKLPELMDILTVPQWVAAEKPTINLWFGKSTVTPLHYDSVNNMFAQVYGHKKFIVFSPDDTPSIYPYPFDSAMPHLAHVDASQPDLTRHPAFANATPLNVDLSAGDLLFLPSFWWHQVLSSDLAISVSFWWNPNIGQIVHSPNTDCDFRRFFEHDRLASFEEAVLIPKGLAFTQFAEMLLAENRVWAASVVALAEFERLSRTLLGNDYPACDSGLSFEQILNEVPSLCAAVTRNNLSESGTSVAENIRSIAHQMAAYPDAEIGIDQVVSVVDALRHPL